MPLAEVVEGERIRRFSEVACELLDRAQVTAHSVRRQVTTLEFLPHPFLQSGHRDLLVAHTLILVETRRLPSAARHPNSRCSWTSLHLLFQPEFDDFRIAGNDPLMCDQFSQHIDRSVSEELQVG